MQSFKDLYSNEFLQEFSSKIVSIFPAFDSDLFVQSTITGEWDQLAFKQRIRRISNSLKVTLPLNYEEALRIIIEVSKSCKGIEYLFLPDFIEVYGIDEYDLSIPALAEVTESSSSEFAIRAFIKKYPNQMIKQLMEWTKSNNEHIRRLASEGCRPLLPWSYRLEMFVTDPSPIIPILEYLRNDNSEYVRRSVANNLNDISKHHPELVKEVTKKWLGQSSNTDKLLKHGCRTLLKGTDHEILSIFGLQQLNSVTVEDFIVTPQVSIGESIEFSFTVVNKENETRKIRIDYEIGFVKANGRISGKKFRLSEKEYKNGKTPIKRKHSFAPITTRTYYKGIHTITIYLNGIGDKRYVFNLV